MAEPATRQDRVSTLELFFDLVFVFTITQVASLLSILIAPSTRRLMPIDLPRLAVIVLVSCATLAAGKLAAVALPANISAVVNVLLISLVAGTLLIRWDMFDARTIWHRLSPFPRRLAS